MRAAGLCVLAVAQAIVTPEMAPSVLIVAAVVAAYEWYWRRSGARFAQAFQRTIWLAIAIVASAGAFAIYMASRGALGDVVYVTVALVAGHFDRGGSAQSRPESPQARFDFIALAPVAALLVSFAYAVVRLRLRRPFLLADWPMAAAALFVLFYYSKFLARMDAPHAYEPFMVATPLMIYIVYRAVSAADRWIRRRLPKRQAGWVTAHPVGDRGLDLLCGVLLGAAAHAVDSAPAAYRPAAPAPAVCPRRVRR